MYLPPAFAGADPATVLDLLRRVGFGHLVTVDADGRPQSTSLPFTVDDHVTTVRAHLARANPHWRDLDGAEALLIVAGADGYVSPRWYPSKLDDGRVVPTWNYELVHLRGSIRLLDDPGVARAVVDELTDTNERRSVGADERPWAVGDAPDDFVAAQLRAIVAIELVVDEVLAKRKLSQNRTEADRSGVVEGLAAAGDPRSEQLVRRMRPGSADPDASPTDGGPDHPERSAQRP